MATEIITTEDLLDFDADSIRGSIENIMNARSVLVSDKIDSISDSDWIKESLTSNITFDESEERTRFYTTADLKFQTTSLGGNLAVNPLPQFTRYADARSKGIAMGRSPVSIADFTGNHGMGHYYSEAFDDSYQTIHMRFGVPEYNSMISFFTGFFDNDTAYLARTGSVIGKFAYLITKVTGMVINIIFWPLLALHIIGYSARFFLGKPASKYFYLRPTMNNYWTAVTTMLNQVAVYKRMLAIDDTQDMPITTINSGARVSPQVQGFLIEALPNIFTENGFIDVYKIANRAQKIYNKASKELSEQLEGKTYNERVLFIRENLGPGLVSMSDDGKNVSLVESSKRWFATQLGTASNEKDYNKVLMHVRTPLNDGATEAGGSGLGEQLAEIASAEWDDGSQFATFRVDATGAVDESFSNTIAESDISQKFNQLSAQGRSATFSLSGGNIDGGIISGAIEGIKGLIGGGLSALHLDGLVSLAGAAFVDIPKHWDNSSANLPKMSYTMQLVSPYGNPISQLINIHLPLCMLLAAALPISTGKQSYTSPFLLELYDRGRAQTRLGIIESLTVVRGTTNLGFSKNKVFMSADVSFTIADLSSVMHMPLTSGFDLNPLKGVMDEDTVYSDYLHVLAGASLQQSVYKGAQLKDNAANYFRRLQALTSADRWAAFIHENTPIGMLDMFFRGTAKN